MKINIDYAALGAKPEPKFIGKNSTLIVNFPIAENINTNKGTKDNPDWQTLRTNWYNVTAWEDVARDILTNGLDKGDIISFSGTHELKRVQRGSEKAEYMGEYTIKEYKVVKKKEHREE